MLGLGSLTLPGVFARVGWIPALILFALCAIGTIYSGRLFTLMAEMVSGPHVFCAVITLKLYPGYVSQYSFGGGK